MSELAKVLGSGSVVSLGSGEESRPSEGEATNSLCFSVDPYTASVLSRLLVDIYTLESRSVVRRSSDVVVILRRGAYSKIPICVIKRVVVAVIGLPLVAKLKSENLPVHGDRSSFPLAPRRERCTTLGVKALGMPVPMSLPMILIHFFEAVRRNFSYLALSELDFAVRWFGGHVRSCANRIRPALITPDPCILSQWVV